MAHANGEVILDSLVVGFFEYDGTCDYAYSRIYDTAAEVQANWRSGAEAHCTCGKAASDVLLYTDYADGSYWPATACLACHAIISGQKYLEYSDVWPKNGHPNERSDDD